MLASDENINIGFALVMLFILLMVGSTIVMMMSQDNPPYYVSWNEFINEMLAKGEVIRLFKIEK